MISKVIQYVQTHIFYTIALHRETCPLGGNCFPSRRTYCQPSILHRNYVRILTYPQYPHFFVHIVPIFIPTKGGPFYGKNHLCTDLYTLSTIFEPVFANPPLWFTNYLFLYSSHKLPIFEIKYMVCS